MILVEEDDRFQERQVELLLDGGAKLKVPARVIGQWAVHLTVAGPPGNWTVTHVPSGLATVGYFDFEAAKRVAVALADRFNIESITLLEKNKARVLETLTAAQNKPVQS